MTQQPKVEWGFYAVTPRIVRVAYKDLSHAEKWLYTCLKDLCGDKGTCFRSMRALKDETDISIASLSTMIPHLHKAGLIHAEKKRRSATGKEIWHISIIDIWQENVKICSNFEQHRSEIEQSEEMEGEIVQNINNVVQKLNENTGDCSEIERDCSNFRDRRITLKNKESEEYGIEEQESTIAPAAQSTAPALAENNNLIADETTPKKLEGVSPIVNPATRYKPSRKAKKNGMESGTSCVDIGSLSHPGVGDDLWSATPDSGRAATRATGGRQRSATRSAKATTPVDFFASASSEAQAVALEWCSIFIDDRPRTKTMMMHAEELAKWKPIPGEIKACRAWEYQRDDKNYFKQQGMHLGDIARDFERFRSLKHAPISGDMISQVQARADEIAPGFRVKTQMEIIEMEPEERKAYGKSFAAHLQQQREESKVAI